MEGEEEHSEKEGSFSNASIPKRIAVVIAGAVVNIIFGLLVFFLLMLYMKKDMYVAFFSTINFIMLLLDNLRILFTGNVNINEMIGPVGISSVISQTQGIQEYIYMLAMISISLGITNLLPIPALDGGKILLLLIEAIRRKPLKQNIEIGIQMLGFILLILLSIFVTYNDINRFF